MKYFEVNVVVSKTYTIQAETEEDAFDIACDEIGGEFIEMSAEELLDQEEIKMSKRHSDWIYEVENW